MRLLKVTEGGAKRQTLSSEKSAASHRGHDGNRLAVRHGGGQTIGETHVVVVYENVDVSVQATPLVNEAVHETGVGGVQRGDHIADGVAVHGDLAGPSGQGTKGGRYPDGHAHGP